MIEVKNNNTRGPQNLSIDILADRDEETFIFITVNDEDSSESIVELYVDDLRDAKALLEDLTRAVKEMEDGQA